MELFRIKNDIPFMRHAKIFNIISFLTFAAAVFFLSTKGLNLSVEFTGGVLVEARYSQPAELEKIREGLRATGIDEPQVQNFGTARDVLVRLAVKDLQSGVLGTEGKLNQQALTEQVLNLGGPNVQLMRVEFVGPQVGRELAENGVIALMVVIIGIMIYLALRFEWKFAVSAIVANLHDVVIILGFFAFFGWEFSLAVLAAILAVLGYSVNESVVVFDRIRETFKKVRKMTVEETIDNAITRTISRTIITHGSTQIMVCSMLFFGGPTLHGFALALTIGICFGIYSSVLVASPLLMWLGLTREDLVKPVKKDKEFETP
ncbi:MAG: protein translocase subunit SecF [Limnobacter sp.]|jgi:preprotein translocase subunit SecF|uniref:Protein-export membrane protein SecF n=1 Tax=Limnobacter profundi TaxID=2732163 RepID=A0ABX6N2P4_9BURK|nr:MULTISPECIES: protein translocase subunit SecF [unclassified Limnobacter]MBA4314018.1 protein translocase subunit SecF [Alcaligenaceae bacterium]MDP3271783.1 protein translocase subunit SecF [Limnobacter sp.]MDZ4048856.1 protein translocase subunit SecF [Limnobacter sp.]PQJ24785.1 protein-export membrane protein SecF [Limnobacter sp. SAORIC-690]QJR28654.1 protein translocase subunit SecF [Limnobacter sp. SAORIC-580]